MTNHRLSILHRPKRPSAALKNIEHADQEFQKEQVCAPCFLRFSQRKALAPTAHHSKSGKGHTWLAVCDCQQLKTAFCILGAYPPAQTGQTISAHDQGMNFRVPHFVDGDYSRKLFAYITPLWHKQQKHTKSSAAWSCTDRQAVKAKLHHTPSQAVDIHVHLNGHFPSQLWPTLHLWLILHMLMLHMLTTTSLFAIQDRHPRANCIDLSRFCLLSTRSVDHSILCPRASRGPTHTQP